MIFVAFACALWREGELTMDNVGSQHILRLGEDELPYVSV